MPVRLEPSLQRSDVPPTNSLVSYALLIMLSTLLFLWSRGIWPWLRVRPLPLLTVPAYAATGLAWAIALNGRSALRPLATGAMFMALTGLVVGTHSGLAPIWLWLTVIASLLLIVAWNAAHLAMAVAQGDGPIGERLRSAITGILPSSFRTLATKEFDIWIALLFPSVLRKRHSGGIAFHMGHTGSDVITMSTLICVGIIEVAVVHLFLYKVAPTFASILLYVSLLTLIYLSGLARSLRAVPTTLETNHLMIRLGILRSQRIELSQICDAYVIGGIEAQSIAARMVISIVDPPNVRVLLNQPHTRRSLFGKARAYSAVDFRLDEPELFTQALALAIGTEKAIAGHQHEGGR
jgi:hypothetical protein